MTGPRASDRADADAWRSPEETARIRDEAFRRLMRMPPKPQEEMKLGKPRRSRHKTELEDQDNLLGPMIK